MRPQAICTKQSAKSIKLQLTVRKRRDRGIALSALCSLLFALFCMLPVLSGCATAKSKATTEVAKQQEPAVIQNIAVQDNKVTITADKPFVFTIYKPGDPYRVIVELPDVSTGAFTKKIVPNKAGITEIVPSQTGAPALMAKLEMLLQSPASIEQDYRNNTLTIMLKEEAAAKEALVKPEDTSPKVRATDIAKRERESLLINRQETPPVAAVQTEQKPFKDAETLRKEVAARKETAVNPAGQKMLQKATEVSDVSLQTSADGVQVLIKGNGSMMPNVFPVDDRIVIDIPDVVMNAVLPSGVISPVKGIRSGKHEDRLRLVLDLREKTNFDVSATGDSISVILKKPGSEPVTPAVIPVVARTYGENPGSKAALESAERIIEKQQKAYEPVSEERCQSFLAGRENVNFDFQDQEIVPILRLFADISGCNLFLHPDVKGKATMKFRDVPWNQALDTILKTFSLDRREEDNIIRIAPLTIFAKESDERVKARESEGKAVPLETKVFPVSYADPTLVEAAVKTSKMLSPRGSISIDKRTSTMVVKDVPGVFPEIEHLLLTLDKPTPQVMIEARIVEVNTNSQRDLGIQWGLNLKASNGLSSLGGLSGIPSTSTGPVTGGNYLVDFPTTGVGPLSGSGITFGILNPAKTMGLDIQLSAIETMGNLKVISNPKVLTVDNGKAKIIQGKSIPVRKQTSEGTISTEFKDVTLELNVVPHITPDKSIAMQIEIKKEELDPTIPSIDGVPGTDKKEANTNVIIQNGETVVIGGMYKITTNDSESGVPGLMKLPILGWLFKNNTKATNTTELLIFVTPRVVDKP